MTQLVLNIEQPSILPSLKKILSLIEGVSIARPVRRTRTACAKKADPTEMTKEEFYAMIDEAKAQVRQGKVGPVFHTAEDAIAYLEAL